VKEIITGKEKGIELLRKKESPKKVVWIRKSDMVGEKE